MANQQPMDMKGNGPLHPAVGPWASEFLHGSVMNKNCTYAVQKLHQSGPIASESVHSFCPFHVIFDMKVHAACSAMDHT